MTDGAAVHDLADPTGGRGVRRAPAPARDLGGPASAVLAAVAVVVAAVPGGGALPHWAIGLALGVLAVLVAFGALRRARRVGALLPPLAAVVLAVVAVVALVLRPADPVDPGTVTVALPAAAAATATGVATATGPGDHTALIGALDGLLEQLHLIRGTAGPYPPALAVLENQVVVADGIARGAVIGTLPPGTRLRYAITPDGGFFQLTLTAPGASPAGVSGDSTVGVGAGG